MEQGINAYQNQDQWDKMYNLKRGLAVASMPWESALGFALGSYIKDYIDRGNENKITNASKEPQTDFLKGLTPENLSNYSIDSTNAITSGGDLNLNNNLEYKGNAITSDNIADKTTENNISNNTSPVAQTVSLLGAVSNLKPKGEIISSSNLPNYGDLSSRQNQQQQMVQNAINEENQKQQNEMNLIMKFLPMSFNNAVASSNEVAANSLPEYLKPRIDYYVNIINSAKADYMKAQANNDTEGMQSANAQANAAREELNKLGVDSSYFGADKTQEQSQKSMADLNYYKEPIPQNVSPFQQQIADKVHSEIIAAKFNYDNATNENERLLAQLQAKKARESANQYGLDMSSYGADTTAERSLLASLNESPKFNMQDASSVYTANPVSTQEYWQQLYEEARAKGAGRTAAERYATQKSAAYQSRKINDLSSQFIQYGINPDGSVGDLGMGILAQLRNENPDAYTQLLSAYGMPKDVFAFNQQIQRDNNNAQNQLIAMNNQGRINSELQNQQYEETANLQALQARQQAEFYQIKAQVDRKYANLGLQDKINVMAKSLIKYGGLDSQTAYLLASGVYNNINGKSSDKQEKPPTYITELNNLISQAMTAVNQYAEFDGDSDEADKLRISSGEAIDAIEDYIEKNKEKLDSDDLYNLNQVMYEANYKRAMAAYTKTGNSAYKNEAESYLKYIDK